MIQTKGISGKWVDAYPISDEAAGRQEVSLYNSKHHPHRLKIVKEKVLYSPSEEIGVK